MSEPVSIDYLSATGINGLITTGQCSASEVIRATIARAEAVQARTNCFAQTLFDEARDAAMHVDELVRLGHQGGPLFGVPITLKDGIATKGHRLAIGSLSRRDDTAPGDDPVWQRLRAAGAILIGKTTTPEFFHKVVTDSALCGITRNPWSLDHSPGGSSGGAAAALAAGVTSLAVGSDGGGSLRCPASCTGTLALKPTMGVIPGADFPDTFASNASIGPMARTVHDLGLLLDIMSGPHPGDAASLRAIADAQDLGHGGQAGFRIGWIAKPGGYECHPAVEREVLATLAVLEHHGCKVRRIAGAFLDGSFETFKTIVSSSHAARLCGQGEAERAQWTQSLASLVRHGHGYSAVQLQAAQISRTKLFRAVQEIFGHVDLIATPTLLSPPKLVDAQGSIESREYAAWAAALFPFNLTGHPAVSVPCGFTDDGLPVGIQLVAPWYREPDLLAAARIVEKHRPWCGSRPPL